jgi:hypothetical protein
VPSGHYPLTYPLKEAIIGLKINLKHKEVGGWELCYPFYSEIILIVFRRDNFYEIILRYSAI